jgi:hypothetical protein
MKIEELKIYLPSTHVLVDTHGRIVITSTESNCKYKIGDVITYTRAENIWMKPDAKFFASIHIDNISKQNED